MVSKIREIVGHVASIYSIDGVNDLVYTASGDHFAARWNIDSGSQDAFAIKAEKAIYCLKLIQQNSILAFGTTSGSIHVIDIENKKEIRHFVQHKTAIFCIQENQSKNHVYSTDSEGNLAVWKADSWDLLLFLPLDCGKIRAICVTENGDNIILACQDGNIRIFETSGFNEIANFFAHENGTNSLAIFPSNPKFLISGGKDGYLRVWDLEDFKMQFEIPAHNYAVYQIIFMNDGKNIVTSSRDKSIKIWKAKDCGFIQKIERKHGGHSHAVNDLWKRTEQQFVSVGDDKRIILWEFEN
jgi:WD40 repeat protein